MKNHIINAHRILTKIFADGTYSNIAFCGEEVSDMTTKLVYGVLEQNIKIEYILKSLVSKKPKNPIYLMLKIGTYALLNLTDVPKFATVSECVEATKKIGKGGASGFVNAVLKKVSREEFKLPNKGDKNYISITYSKPQWFVDKLINEYGLQKTLALFAQPEYNLEHIRANKRLSSLEDIKKILTKKKINFKESSIGGLSLSASNETKALFDKGLITYQSASSMLAVKALKATEKSKILDLCSAPGGKAIYIEENLRQSEITACDVHKHRLELVEKYKKRMRCRNINTVLQDATQFNADFENQFDYVLVDAPCSCFGTYPKHPDVFLSRDENDIAKLIKTQKSILDNAVLYLKKGGVLVYSTCTIFKEENQDIADYIETKHKLKKEKMPISFENDGELQLLPNKEWDGFYIARFRKL